MGGPRRTNRARMRTPLGRAAASVPGIPARGVSGINAYISRRYPADGSRLRHRHRTARTQPCDGRAGSRIAACGNHHAAVHHQHDLLQVDRPAGNHRRPPQRKLGWQSLMGNIFFTFAVCFASTYAIVHFRPGSKQWPSNGKRNGAPAVNGQRLSDRGSQLRRGRGRRRRLRPARLVGCSERACAPPASARCSRPARTPFPRKAASPPRSATWARTTGAGTCTTPSRAPTGSATRTPSNICCRNAPDAVYELEHWGLPFSRREEDGKFTSARSAA